MGETHWRMAFRRGSQGREMFQHCFEKGIAALGYYEYESRKPIVEDCSKISKEEFIRIWRTKWPNPGTARKSLEYVAYEMKKGDIIYAKQGPEIVGRGEIVSGYQYDPNILRDVDGKWEHFVRVNWQKNFKPFRLVIDPSYPTVLKLEGENLSKILAEDQKNNPNLEGNKEIDVSAQKQLQTMEEKDFDDPIEPVLEDEEGRKSLKIHLARERLNRLVLAFKKSLSSFKCSICDFDFEKTYGPIGKGFIEAHHKKPVAYLEPNEKVRIEDIVPLCSNCHRMIHRINPIPSLGEFEKLIKKGKRE